MVGPLADLMLGKVLSPKYLDPSSLVVDVHINSIIFPNALIGLGDTINVMTRETMFNLNLQGALRKTHMVLQLLDRSIVSPEGVI